MLLLYGVVMSVPSLRAFFELTPLRGWDYLLIGVVAVAWALLLRLAWRTRLFERLLDLRVNEGAAGDDSAV
jgi:cation-transporting ATPase E